MPHEFLFAKGFCNTQDIIEQCSTSLDGNTLVSEGKRVMWYAAGGIQLLKQLTFPLAPLDVKLFRFSTAQPAHESQSGLKLAVAVLLPNDDLHICLLSGETYDIHLPCPVRAMLALPRGLLLQRDTYGVSSQLQFLLLSNPLAPFSTICNHVS